MDGQARHTDAGPPIKRPVSLPAGVRRGLPKCDRRAQVITHVRLRWPCRCRVATASSPRSLCPVDVDGKGARLARYGVMEKAICQNTLDIRHD
jgi:hypothetical protein